MKIRNKFIVAQLGARMHYAVPEILVKNDMLDTFYTDITNTSTFLRYTLEFPWVKNYKIARRFKGRQISEALQKRTIEYPLLGLAYLALLRLATSLESRTKVHLWAGRKFGNKIVKNIINEVDSVYCYTSAGLELLREAKAEGLTSYLEQFILPQQLRDQMLKEEQEKYPNWQNPVNLSKVAKILWERVEEEWELADYIICPSNYVANNLSKLIANPDKCIVVPYGVDLTDQIGKIYDKKYINHDRKKLHVLFVGSVDLRKGPQYIYEAMQLLNRNDIEIRFIGPIQVTKEAVHLLSEIGTVLGQVPRKEMEIHFDWADVFLLPSLAEGSATVTYEALNYGVPVICTENTGSIVRDGYNGYIVPIRDSISIAICLSKLLEDRNELEMLSKNALESAKECTLEAYERRLVVALERTD